MSAFLCNPAHVGQLAAFVRRDRHTRYTPEELAETFARANLASVGYRYKMTADKTATEFLGEPDAETYVRACVAEAVAPCVLSPVMAIKMAHCLDYQCCEVEDWRGSVAEWRLRELEAIAARSLDGYDVAPWEYTPAEVAP